MNEFAIQRLIYLDTSWLMSAPNLSWKVICLLYTANGIAHSWVQTLAKARFWPNVFIRLKVFPNESAAEANQVPSVNEHLSMSIHYIFTNITSILESEQFSLKQD